MSRWLGGWLGGWVAGWLAGPAPHLLPSCLDAVLPSPSTSPSRQPCPPPTVLLAPPAPAAIVDHPGTWESASHAYLNEVLVSKRGVPAALAIVLADLVRRLLLLVSRKLERRPLLAAGGCRLLALRAEPTGPAAPAAIHTCTICSCRGAAVTTFSLNGAVSVELPFTCPLLCLLYFPAAAGCHRLCCDSSSLFPCL